MSGELYERASIQRRPATIQSVLCCGLSALIENMYWVWIVIWLHRCQVLSVQFNLSIIPWPALTFWIFRGLGQNQLIVTVIACSFCTVTCWAICETQWRHSVKTKLYNTPSPILHSMKRSDVTRWKQGYMRSPPPYFIVLASENKGGQGHWVSQNSAKFPLS